MRLQVTASGPLLLAGAVLLALSGCATSPISKNLRQQAKPLTVAQVVTSPDSAKGTVVIWGGQVVETVNDTNGSSIYVLQLPLDNYGRPVRSGMSGGRFIARHSGFIDPEVFKNGKLITVAGPIAGVETHPLQKLQYSYPVVAIDELHLWHLRPPSYYYNPPPAWGWGFYGPSGWTGGWYGPGWGGWYGPGYGWGPAWEGDFY